MPQSMKWLGLSAACVLACCAGPQATQTPEMDRTSAIRAFGDQQQLEVELSAAYSTDCGRACELKTEICRLSGLICEIAEQNPQDVALEDMCFEANLRCEAATIEVTARCECSSAEKLQVRKTVELPVAVPRLHVNYCFVPSLAT